MQHQRIAKALIDQGADVIAQHTDSTAIVQMAEKAGDRKSVV